MNDSIAKYYENDPKAMPWREQQGDRREIGLFIGQVIKDELTIPRVPVGKKTIILSVASNIGVMEQGMQEEVGDNFLVVANDFANIPRLAGVQPLFSDARVLPIADNSIPCVVDVAGALWHQLAEDKLNRRDLLKSKNGERILQHYLTKLQQNGVMMIDDGFEKSTGQLIDDIFGGPNLDGFSKPIFVGEEPFKLRVYRKL